MRPFGLYHNNQISEHLDSPIANVVYRWPYLWDVILNAVAALNGLNRMDD